MPYKAPELQTRIMGKSVLFLILLSQRWEPLFSKKIIYLFIYSYKSQLLLHLLCLILKSFHCFHSSLPDSAPAEVKNLLSKSFYQISWTAKIMAEYIWLKWYLLSFDFSESLPEGMLLFVLCSWRIEG